MKRRAVQRRGFATFTAIVVTAVAAVSLVALGELFATQARRTRATRSEAQLRQLLHAGTTETLQLAEDAADGSREVELPAGLKDAGARVTVTFRTGGNGRQIGVVASGFGGTAEQRITLRRAGTGWMIAQAELMP